MTAACLSIKFASDICACSTVELTASRIFLQVYWGSLVPSPIYVEWVGQWQHDREALFLKVMLYIVLAYNVSALKHHCEVLCLPWGDR